MQAVIVTMADTLLVRKASTVLETLGSAEAVKLFYTLADTKGKTDAGETSAQTG